MAVFRRFSLDMNVYDRAFSTWIDSGRLMAKADSPEVEAAVQSQKEDEQEQRLVYNKDLQFIQIINPFVR